MRYVYHCDACLLSSPERDHEDEVRADRDRHRGRAHDGLIPDDWIQEVPGPLDQVPAAAWALAVSVVKAGAGLSWRLVRSEPVRQMRQTVYWQQAVRLLGVGVAVVVVVAVIRALIS